VKRSVCLFVVCCLFLVCFAGDNEPVGRINSVQRQSGENKNGDDVEILKINTIQSGKIFEGVLRISMMLEGKNGKVAWGKIERAQPIGEVKRGYLKGSKRTGAVSWKCEAFNSALKRPKLTAYSVEYGYKKDDKFVVLEDEFYKTTDLEELAEKNKGSLRLKMGLSHRAMVDFSPF